MFVVGADNTAQYREVELGPLSDGLRVVASGLKAGELVVVNGLQRVRPGAPVNAQVLAVDAQGMPVEPPPPAPPGRRRPRPRCQAPRRRREAQRMNISRFFIDRPIFAAVLSIVIFVAGLIAMLRLPISEYPEVVPPSVVVRALYPGRQPEGDRRDRGRAARGADQRRREHAVHVSRRPPPTAC